MYKFEHIWSHIQYAAANKLLAIISVQIFYVRQRNFMYVIYSVTNSSVRAVCKIEKA